MLKRFITLYKNSMELRMAAFNYMIRTKDWKSVSISVVFLPIGLVLEFLTCVIGCINVQQFNEIIYECIITKEIYQEMA